jgi:hypothetical protein
MAQWNPLEDFHGVPRFGYPKFGLPIRAIPGKFTTIEVIVVPKDFDVQGGGRIKYKKDVRLIESEDEILEIIIHFVLMEK